MRAILEPKDQPRLLHRSTKKPFSPGGSKKSPRECDFYKNPTLSSRLILHQKYSAATRQLQQYPEEAAIWVCVKRLLPELQAVTATTSSTSQEQVVVAAESIIFHAPAPTPLRLPRFGPHRNRINQLLRSRIAHSAARPSVPRCLLGTRSIGLLALARGRQVRGRSCGGHDFHALVRGALCRSPKRPVRTIGTAPQ